AEAYAVPALADLRAGGADPEDHAAVRELVDRRRGHRRHAGRPGGDLEDRRSEPDLLRLSGEPAEDRRRVRPVGLRGPDRVVAEALGGLNDLELVLAPEAHAPVANVNSELHLRSFGRTGQAGRP